MSAELKALAMKMYVQGEPTALISARTGFRESDISVLGERMPDTASGAESVAERDELNDQAEVDRPPNPLRERLSNHAEATTGARALAMLENGDDFETVCQATGYLMGTVRNMATSAGITVSKSPGRSKRVVLSSTPKFLPRDPPEALALPADFNGARLAGRMQQDIGDDRFGRGAQMGEELRIAEPGSKRGRRPSPHKHEAIRMYGQGVAVELISAQTGYAESSIAVLARAAGVKRPKRSSWNRPTAARGAAAVVELGLIHADAAVFDDNFAYRPHDPSTEARPPAPPMSDPQVLSSEVVSMIGRRARAGGKSSDELVKSAIEIASFVGEQIKSGSAIFMRRPDGGIVELFAP